MLIPGLNNDARIANLINPTCTAPVYSYARMLLNLGCNKKNQQLKSKAGFTFHFIDNISNDALSDQRKT